MKKKKVFFSSVCVFALSSLFYLHKHFKVLKCQAQDPLIRSRNKEPLKNNKNILLFQDLPMKLYQKNSFVFRYKHSKN